MNKKVRSGIILAAVVLVVALCIVKFGKDNSSGGNKTNTNSTSQSSESLDKETSSKDDANTESSGDKGPEATISIMCDQVAGDDVTIIDDNTKTYVPEDGVILAETSYEIEEGTTAYDMLVAACKEQDIQLDSEIAEYGAYVKGVNYIYEVSMDNTYAGWIYTVNGEQMNFTAENYVVQEGDKVEWFYSVMTF